MLGKLNTYCEWKKLSSNSKYNESTYSDSLSLPCTIGKEIRLKQTETGLQSEEVQYFILHNGCVSDGDLLDGFVVAVSEIKDLAGKTAYYKAVVVNG